MARTLVGGSGWFPARLVSPMWAIARVPLSNPVAALELSKLIAAPRSVAFRASRPALARPSRERQRERRPGRRGGGASGPAGRLENRTEISHTHSGPLGIGATLVLRRVMRDTRPSTDLRQSKARIAMSGIADVRCVVRTQRQLVGRSPGARGPREPGRSRATLSASGARPLRSLLGVRPPSSGDPSELSRAVQQLPGHRLLVRCWGS